MDAAARKQLVDEHVALVRACALSVRRQIAARLEVDDLVAYGVTGLMEAAERFDPRYGVTFVTFAYHRIRGAIYDGLRQMGSLRRAEYQRLRAAQSAHEYVSNLADREQGAAATGGGARPAPTAEDDLRSMYDAMQNVAVSFVASYEGLQDEGEEFAADDPSAEELLAVRQVAGRVRAVLPELPEKERHFIEKHYFEGKTLLDAGAELGLSKSWASRLHARALELLREKLAVADG